MKIMNWRKSFGTALVSVVFLGFLIGANGQQEQDDAPAAETPAAATNALTATTGDSGQVAEASARRATRSREAIVAFGSKAELKAGERAQAVVAILGAAVARGEVNDAVVAVAGDVTVSGTVGEAAVAVFGDVNIESDAVVEGDVVSVGGVVRIADGAKVNGEVVCVGGTVDIAEGAKVQGGIQEVPVPGLHGVKDWVVHCVFKLRPLAPQVGWVWVIAGAFLLVYLLIAAATPRPVAACVRELNRRPATTFLMGLLTLLLVPVIMVILAATGVGVFVIPFLLAALFFGKLIGKAAFLEFLGESVVHAFSSSSQLKPVVALLLGSVIIAVIYLVPVLGLIAFMVTGTWALGAAVMGMFAGARRELPDQPAAPLTPNSTPAAPVAAGSAAFVNAPAGPATPESATAAASSEAASGTANPASSPTPMSVPGDTSARTPEALVYPRASFWERMGAGFLDVVLVSILGGLTGPFWFVVALAYFAGMWAWKGTTVGGIVLNLKVVRLDDQPVTITVGLVRALIAAFSVVVFFLGFLWIAWDREKQSWHDKVAGTVVVRLPRGMPLVCL